MAFHLLIVRKLQKGAGANLPGRILHVIEIWAVTVRASTDSTHERCTSESAVTDTGSPFRKEASRVSGD